MSYLPDPATLSRYGDQEVAGQTRFVATGAQTRGDFGLFEVTSRRAVADPARTCTARSASPSTCWRAASRCWTATAGRRRGRATWSTSRGRGVHGFRAADEDAGCRFLILFTPGHRGSDYFRGMVELRAGGRTPTTEELDELAARYDQLNLRD